MTSKGNKPKCYCGWHSANCSERKNKGRVWQINHGYWDSQKAADKFIMKEKSLRKRLNQKETQIAVLKLKED